MNTLKRQRLRRAVAALLMPLTAVPLWALSAAPAAAQTGDSTAAPGLPAPTATGSAAPAAPTGATVKGSASAVTVAGSPATLRGSLVVWPFDVTGVANPDPALSTNAENDVVTAMGGRTGLRVAALKPDPYANTATVNRGIQENALRGDFQRIVTSTGPTTAEAASAARWLGFDLALTGAVTNLSFDPASRTATASLSAQVVDATQPDGAMVEGPITVTSTTPAQPAGVRPNMAEQIALSQAARDLASRLLPGMVSSSARANGSSFGRVFMKALPYVLGIAVIAAAVSAAHSSSRSSLPSGSSQFAPRNALLGSGATAGLPYVALSFVPPNFAIGNVLNYEIHRVDLTSGGDTVAVTIPAETTVPDASGRISATDAHATPGHSYEYYVRSLLAAGGASAPVYFVTTNNSKTIQFGVPSAPTGLTFQVVNGAVTLTWSPSNDALASGYQVYRSSVKPQNINQMTVISPVLQSTNFTDQSPNLQHGSTYYYAVVAVSSTNPPTNSAPSNLVAVAF